jgi:hypothetical protein
MLSEQMVGLFPPPRSQSRNLGLPGANSWVRNAIGIKFEGDYTGEFLAHKLVFNTINILR